MLGVVFAVAVLCAAPAAAQFGLDRSTSLFGTDDEALVTGAYLGAVDTYYAVGDGCTVFRVALNLPTVTPVDLLPLDDCTDALVAVRSDEISFAVGNEVFHLPTTVSSLRSTKLGNYTAISMEYRPSSGLAVLAYDATNDQYAILEVNTGTNQVVSTLELTGVPAGTVSQPVVFRTLVDDLLSFFLTTVFANGVVMRAPLTGGAVSVRDVSESGTATTAMLSSNVIYIAVGRSLARYELFTEVVLPAVPVLTAPETSIMSMTSNGAHLYIAVNAPTPVFSKILIEAASDTVERETAGDFAIPDAENIFDSERRSFAGTVFFLSRGGAGQATYVELSVDLECVSPTCSGQGECTNGECVCDDGFWGNACSFILCPGGETCGGRGSCLPNGECSCNEGFWGEDCTNIDCPGIGQNCRFHGECLPTGVCECDIGFLLDDCRGACGNTTVNVEVPGPDGDLVETSVLVGDPDRLGQVVPACNSRGTCPEEWTHECGTCLVKCDCEEGFYDAACDCPAQALAAGSDDVEQVILAGGAKRMFIGAAEYPSGARVRVTTGQVTDVVELYAGIEDECPSYRSSFFPANTTSSGLAVLEWDACASQIDDNLMIELHNAGFSQVRATLIIEDFTPALRPGETVQGSINTPGEWQYFGLYMPVSSFLSVEINEFAQNSRDLGNIEAYLARGSCPTELSYLEVDTEKVGATLRLDPGTGLPAGRYIVGIRVTDSPVSLPKYAFEITAQYNDRNRDEMAGAAGSAPSTSLVAVLVAVAMMMLVGM